MNSFFFDFSFEPICVSDWQQAIIHSLGINASIPDNNNCSLINLFLSIYFWFGFWSGVCSESKNYKIGIFYRTGDWCGCCGQTTNATFNNTRCRATRSSLSITLRQPENRFLSTRKRLYAVLFMRWKWHISRIAMSKHIGIRCRFFGAYTRIQCTFIYSVCPIWLNRMQ